MFENIFTNFLILEMKLPPRICVVDGGVVGLTTTVIIQQQCPRAQVQRLTHVKHHTCTINCNLEGDILKYDILTQWRLCNTILCTMIIIFKSAFLTMFNTELD